MQESIMTFYDASETVRKRMIDEETRCFPRFFYNSIDGIMKFPDEDILSLELTSYKTVDGGIVTCAKIELDDTAGFYTDGRNVAFKRGLAVEVWFCFDIDGSADFKRCCLYIGEKGFESLQDGGGKKTCRVELVDYSFFLKLMSVCKEWEKVLPFSDCAVCDSENTEKSLLHGIAANANGLSVKNCDNVKLRIPYCECSRTVWEELCELALTYRVYLECEEKGILFMESEYAESTIDMKSQFSLFEDVITHLHSFNECENYANDILLKYRRKTEDGEREVRRVFSFDRTEIEKLWRVPLRKSGHFISDGQTGGKDFEQKLCDRWLEEHLCKGKIYYITTFLALANARVGAFMEIRLGGGRKPVRTKIDELTLCYKKNAAFETRLWLRGEQ